MKRVLSVAAVSTATAAYLTSTSSCAHDLLSRVTQHSVGLRSAWIESTRLGGHKGISSANPLPVEQLLDSSGVLKVAQNQLLQEGVWLSSEKARLLHLLEAASDSAPTTSSSAMRNNLIFDIEPYTTSAQSILCNAVEAHEISHSISFLQTSTNNCVLNSAQLHTSITSHLLRSASDDVSTGSDKKKKKADLEQLLRVQEYLIDHIPTIFVKKQEYDYFRHDVVLENNYWAKPHTCSGIKAYVWEMTKVRFLAHARYSHVKLDLLKISMHEDECAVKVRWRVSGITTMQTFKFWNFLPGRWRNTINKEPTWHDGISTFYVHKDGLIAKHRVDRMLTQESGVTATSDLGVKAATLLGLAPKAHASTNTSGHVQSLCSRSVCYD